uniref:Uncharacterized protein n=1 Tax=Oncorhynchus kisutch TaxID=8019 RepID=A0A8C7IVE6_ONCKI
ITGQVNSNKAKMRHEGSQIPHDHLVTVIRLLQALMQLMVISSLPNLLTSWYSALHCLSKSLQILGKIIFTIKMHLYN